jgi:NitT/TauT family transport system substrate-binding protein
MNKQRYLTYTFVLFSLLLLVACGGSETAEVTTEGNHSEADSSDEAEEYSSTEEHDSEEAESSDSSRAITLAMGFIPNVQFAPFYVAMDKGYFAEEGIELTLDYGMENDLVELVAANELQFSIASGDQVLLGRAGGRPIRYVANWYRRFPVAVTSIEHDINDPKALEGKTVGLPGLFGANYIGWLALVQATGIDGDSIALEAIGFNQVPVLAEGQVDAVVVYATNEPLQLQNQGYDVSTIYIADVIDLVANGLITNEETIQNDPELVQGMVRAMLRGINDVINDPDGAFEIVRAEEWGTGIDDDNAETQRAVLQASLDFWHNENPGVVPASAWEISHDFMINSGLLSEPISLDDAYTNEFAEKGEISGR